MSRAELKEKFPQDFPVDKLPDGAEEKSISVYRICRSGAVEPASFLPTYLDEISKVKEHDDEDIDIGYYSLSTFEDEKDARKKLKFFRGKQPHAILSKGVTDPSCGPCQRTRERKSSKHVRSHVDWWLYRDATPHIFFEKVCIEGNEST